MWLWIFNRTHFYLAIHSIDSIAFICIIYAGIRISRVHTSPAQPSPLQIIIAYMHSYNWVWYNEIVLVMLPQILFALITN